MATELHELFDDTDVAHAILLVRAFTVYFHLANVAEQVHRIEDLNSGSPNAANQFEETIHSLVATGITPNEIATLIGRAEVRPVFTAHPTEASRRAILDKLATVSQLLEQRSEQRRTEADQRRIDRRIEEIIDAVWQTDELRHVRPEPMDEARSVLYYIGLTVREAIPDLFDEMQAALRLHRPVAARRPGTHPLRVMGGWRPGRQPQRATGHHRRGARPAAPPRARGPHRGDQSI